MKQFNENAFEQAAAAFAAGEILTFPTDTVYGVGVRYGNREDLQRLKEIKHRPETKPIPVMVNGIEMMRQICQVGQREEKIVARLLPGALTLILPLKEEVDRELFNGNETAAVRIPEADFILKTITALGVPLFVTSANVSGEPAALTFEEAMEALPRADGAVKGSCQAMQASTIVDCTQKELKILRPGPISLEEIQAAAL